MEFSAYILVYIYNNYYYIKCIVKYLEAQPIICQMKYYRLRLQRIILNWCYLEDIKTLKKCFLSLEIIYVPQTKNLRADSRTQCQKKKSSFIIHMDAELSSWFTESV